MTAFGKWSEFDVAEREKRLFGRKKADKPIAEGVDLESDLHDQIIAHCKTKKWIYFHGSMAHKTFRTIAEPDFIILAENGRVHFCEIKSKTGKLTNEQLGMKQWAETLGHTIHTIRSMSEFLDIIK